MTCHVALAVPGYGCVMISDSQASTQTSELHGQAKQFIGSDFLVGGSGSMRVIVEMFAFLTEMSKSGGMTGTNAPTIIKRFVDTRLKANRPAASSRKTWNASARGWHRKAARSQATRAHSAGRSGCSERASLRPGVKERLCHHEPVCQARFLTSVRHVCQWALSAGTMPT